MEKGRFDKQPLAKLYLMSAPYVFFKVPFSKILTKSEKKWICVYFFQFGSLKTRSLVSDFVRFPVLEFQVCY